MKYGMAIDLDKCTGCGACMVACMSENNVPFKEDESDKLDSITWMRVYKLTNGKSFPDTDICYLPRPCQHCEGHGGFTVPACRSARPQPRITAWKPASSARSTPAASVAGTAWGLSIPRPLLQLVGSGLARGHGKIPQPQCVAAHARGGGKMQFLFPPLPAGQGTAYANGESRELEEEAYQTACTQACPAGAIVFGDLNNPRTRVHQIVRPDTNGGNKSRNPRAFRLLERTGYQHQGLLPVQPGMGPAGRRQLPGPRKTGQVSKPHH
jgi:Fe-S-cluster-containing dehydrogenase component